MEKKSYLTPNQVAELLMVSSASVRYWAEKGQLTALSTPGGHRRFLPKDVERFAHERGLRLNSASPNQMRILVVDDDMAFLGYLSELLSGQSENIVVETAADGFSAGLKVQSFKPDIVLLDLRIPAMDGFEVCRILKTDPNTMSVRVVAMSGDLSKENESKIVEMGAEACLKKPIESKILFDIIGISHQEDFIP